MKIDKMVEMLISAKDAYYSGNTIMTDEDFDKLEDDLRDIDPGNEYFTIVGASINVKTKAQHEIPMLSCDKCKTVEETIQWIKKMGVEGKELVVEPKIDGLSCSILYDDGKLLRVTTRGDGKVGQNITHVAEFVKDVPKKISVKGRKEVRGELYLPKNTKAPNPENKPLRNIAVGFVNRKDSGVEDLRFLRFVAYQFLDLSKGYPAGYLLPRYENNKLKDLASLKFNTVVWTVISSEKDLEKFYKDYLTKLRAVWEYETDGLVLTVNDSDLWKELDAKYIVHHHHFYNLALKPPSSAAETVLESISWQVSRFGKVVPTANVKPVVIDGRIIKRASLSNYKNVLRMKLEKGDRVLIEVANDVIPYLSKNLSKDVSQR